MAGRTADDTASRDTLCEVYVVAVHLGQPLSS